jgi:hypothetical protein
MCAPALQELRETPISISIATITENFFIMYVLVCIIKNCAAVNFEKTELIANHYCAEFE